jgi:putative ABC transport system permease protein
VVFPLLGDTLDVSLIGVEAGKPGEPEIFEGRRLRTSRGMEVILDEDVARQTGVAVGDTITIKTIQGTEDEYYELEVVGITDGQQYFFLPAIFVPFETWEKVRPQQGSGGERFANIVALQLAEGLDPAAVIPALEAFVDGVEAAEIVTVYEAGPGYAAQQSTVNTQKGFTLLIAILVIGGFFQIQTLQKVPQIGMLKAIGASNRVVAQAAVAQIIFVTGFGVAVGAACTLALSLGFPPSIPIVFTGNAFVAAVISLLAIGPLGGLVAIRAALKVEPLTALGLGG